MMGDARLVADAIRPITVNSLCDPRRLTFCRDRSALQLTFCGLFGDPHLRPVRADAPLCDRRAEWRRGETKALQGPSGIWPTCWHISLIACPRWCGVQSDALPPACRDPESPAVCSHEEGVSPRRSANRASAGTRAGCRIFRTRSKQSYAVAIFSRPAVPTLRVSSSMPTPHQMPPTWLDATLDVDVNNYLPDDLLVKVDIATMAHGLEGRSPLLDHNVMEFAASLPSNFEVKNGIKKHILKKAVESLLPAEISRQAQNGFRRAASKPGSVMS